MSVTIKHEPPGVIVEFDGGNREVFQKGTHRAKVEGDILYAYANDSGIRMKIADNIEAVTAIYDKGQSVSVPATMQLLFDTIWIFFLNPDVIKIITMPLAEEGGQDVAYTGFSLDYDAGTNEAKWAVKKQYEDTSQQWAGRSDFDQVLDDYLSLSYA